MITLSKKYILTKTSTSYTKEAEILAIVSNDKITDVSIEYPDEEDDLNNIFVGHVKDVVKNINSAFVEYKKGHLAYLSLNECKKPVFVNKKNTPKVCEGDNIIVQLVKEPVKTKYGVLSTDLSIAGKYVVVNISGPAINVSKKITNQALIEQYISSLSEVLCSSDDIEKDSDAFESKIGFIVRTDALTANIKDIVDEAKKLKTKLLDIISTGKTRTAFSQLYKSFNANLSLIKDMIEDGDEVVCDNNEMLEQVKNSLDIYSKKVDFRLYTDELWPLHKMYNFEGTFKKMQSTNIWLDSGAYIIIEYTEAMTVIDVNTGKCQKGKDKEKTFLNINLEAAEEIMYQLRLRNISGIIICDFINMEIKENDTILMNKLKELAKKDRINVNIVDMTKLKLIELTRKKVRDKITFKK